MGPLNFIGLDKEFKLCAFQQMYHDTGIVVHSDVICAYIYPSINNIAYFLQNVNPIIDFILIMRYNKILCINCIIHCTIHCVFHRTVQKQNKKRLDTIIDDADALYICSTKNHLQNHIRTIPSLLSDQKCASRRT